MSNGRMYLDMNTLKLIGAPQKSKRTVAPEILKDRGRSVAALNKARKLAASVGVDIEKDGPNGWWVTCEKFEEGANDPLDGNHFASDGQEVLSLVETYAGALT